jgi:hypothetical protein
MRKRCQSSAHLCGWMCYPAAILRAFSVQGKEGIRVWPQLIIGQVIKTQKKYRLESVKHTLLRGDENDLHVSLEQSQGGTQINTSYIERLNATMRERLASLTRKCRHANWHLSAFQWGMYFIGCTYNLCWIHHQLDQTPAMAAGLTDHAWSIQEVLTYKIPPHLLAQAKEDEMQELAPPLPVPRSSQCVRAKPSPYYLALLRLKEEEARRQFQAL